MRNKKSDRGETLSLFFCASARRTANQQLETIFRNDDQFKRKNNKNAETLYHCKPLRRKEKAGIVNFIAKFANKRKVVLTN